MNAKRIISQMKAAAQRHPPRHVAPHPSSTRLHEWFLLPLPLRFSYKKLPPIDILIVNRVYIKTIFRDLVSTLRCHRLLRWMCSAAPMETPWCVCSIVSARHAEQYCSPTSRRLLEDRSPDPRCCCNFFLSKDSVRHT